MKKDRTEVLDYVIEKLIASTDRLTEEGKQGQNLQLEFQKAKHIKENMKGIVDAVKTGVFNDKLQWEMGKNTLPGLEEKNDI